MKIANNNNDWERGGIVKAATTCQQLPPWRALLLLLWHWWDNDEKGNNHHNDEDGDDDNIGDSMNEVEADDNYCGNSTILESRTIITHCKEEEKEEGGWGDWEGGEEEEWEEKKEMQSKIFWQPFQITAGNFFQANCLIWLCSLVMTPMQLLMDMLVSNSLGQ